MVYSGLSEKVELYMNLKLFGIYFDRPDRSLYM